MKTSLALVLVGCVSISGLLASSMQPETLRPRYRPVMNEHRRKALDQLKADLNSPEVEVRRRAVQQAGVAIVLTAEGRRLAEGCLKDGDPKIRLMAAQRLVERRDADPHPDLLPVLLVLLDHSDYSVWRGSFETVSQLGRQAQGAGPIFRRWLTHEDTLRRMLAVRALIWLGHSPREELPKLIAALPAARHAYGYELIRAVASFGPEAKPALPIMAGLLKTGEGINRDELVSRMVGIDPACPEAFAYFVELLKDKNPDQRKKAAFRLGYLDHLNDEAIQALAVAMRDADVEVRTQAATALQDRGAATHALIPDLMEALQHPPSVNSMQWYVKPLFSVHPASVALEGMGQTAVPALQAALKHKLPQVRVEAAWTLVRLRQGNREDILAVLREKVPPHDQRTAQITLQAVTVFDESGEAALPLLVDGLKSDHLPVRWAAMRAILHFGGKARRFMPDIQALARKLPPMEQPEAALVLAHQDDYRQQGVTILASSLDRRFTREERQSTTGQEYMRLQQRAIRMVGELGPRAAEAVPGLIGCLEDGWLRFDAVRALGLIGPTAKAAVPALRQGMAQGQPLFDMFCAAALVQVDPAAQDAMDMVLRHACQDSEQERHTAFQLLARLGPQAAPQVAMMLGDLSLAMDREVYSNWVRLLGGMGPHARNCIPFLEREMVHVDAVPQIAISLLRIDPENTKVHTYLRACLRDNHRDQAFSIIGAAGPGGKAFLPEAQADLKSPERRIRREAAARVKSMETDPYTPNLW